MTNDNQTISVYQKRIQLFDLARGFAILLVILMHWQGWFPFWSSPELLWYKALSNLNTIFSPIRMEMLFFISGLFVKLKPGFFNKKITHILYPYLIWSTILFILDGPANVLDLQWKYYLRVFVGTTSLTWYLFFLFNFYLLIYCIQKWSEFKVVMATVLAYFVFKSYESTIIPTFLQASWVNYHSVCYYFLFFYLGYCLSKNKQIILDLINNKRYVLISALSFCIVALVSLESKIPNTSILYFPWVASSLVFLFYISKIIEKTKLGEFLLVLGENSLFYYILHYVIFDAYFQLGKFAGIELIRNSAIAYLALFIALTLPYIVSKNKLLTYLFKIERKSEIYKTKG